MLYFICNRFYFKYSWYIVLYFYLPMDKKLLSNIKMFIIGAILLLVSFFYISGHPGEWNSFVPSLQMLYYKGEVFVYKLTGRDVRKLEAKQQLEKIYNELSYLVESSKCTDEALLWKIKDQQELLKNIKSNSLELEQYSIIATAQELKREIEEQCALNSSQEEEVSLEEDSWENQ